MSALSQKTLQAIQEKRVQPIPLWKIRFKNSFYWAAVWLLGILAILATALSWHILFEIDWDAYEQAEFTWLERIWSGVPFASLFLLGLFLVGSVAFLRVTRRGYRYQYILLGSFLLTASIFLGYVFEESPADEPTEKFLMQALPQAKVLQMLPSVEKQWSQPEKGLLGGAVISSDQTGSIQILDTREKQWDVDISQAVDARDQEDDQKEVKIIGKQTDEHAFEAKEIRSWKGRVQKETNKHQEEREENERED